MIPEEITKVAVKGRSCYLLSEKGSITVLLALLIPVMLLMVMLIADIGQLVFEKIRLQNTVDACALGAATVQSVGLNEIADLNRDLVLEHRKLKGILEQGIWYSESQGKRALHFFYNGSAGVLDYIHRYQKQANAIYAHLAYDIAEKVKDDNLPYSVLTWQNPHDHLTTYKKHYKARSFLYYNVTCDCPFTPVLTWFNPDDPRFIGEHDGSRLIPWRRQIIRRSISHVLERTEKTNLTYAHLTLYQHPKGLILASSIFGYMPELTASACAKPAGGHIYNGEPYYRPVMIE